MQDYTDPLFVEQERDRIGLEVVSAFGHNLARFHSLSPEMAFLRSRHLYLGPYSDSPREAREQFSNIATKYPGPRYTISVERTPDGLVASGKKSICSRHGKACV